MRALVTITCTALLAACAAGPSSAEAAAADHLGVDIPTLRTFKAKKGLSDEQVLSLSGHVRDAVHRKLNAKRTGHPMDAEQWRVKTLTDQAGNIPTNALVNAKAEAAALGMVDSGTGGLSANNWTALGPDNIGGRTRALTFHPTIPDRIYAGSVAGGVWRSDDAGQTWSPSSGDMTNLAVTDIVFVPGSSTVMLASTGEGFGNLDAIRGAGIWRSSDAGQTWSQLPSTAGLDFQWVNDLCFSSTGTTLLAATGTGIWKSFNQGNSFVKVAGSVNARSLCVEIDPNNPTLAIGHLTDYDWTLGTWYSTAVYSVNSGNSWTEVSGNVRTNGYNDRIQLCWHRGYTGAGNGCVYAQKYVSAGGTTQLFRSLDGGATYSLVHTSSITGDQGWYDNCLWVDPSDTDADPTNDVIVCGGIDLHRSSNGGATFSAISQWWQWPTSAHADHHRIVEAPGFNGTSDKTVYFTNDGGIWRADDVYSVLPLSGWTSRNNGYAVTQLYGASRHAGSGITIAGSQDNGTLRTNGPTSWSTMQGGDGGFCASDPNDSNYHYGEYIYLQIERSSNGGNSSSAIYGPISGGNFIAPFVLDPNNPNRIFAGGDVLWRSNNVKSSSVSWASIKPPTGEPISAVAVAVGNSDRCFVGHNNGRVYRSDNATAASPSWTLVSGSNFTIPGRFVTRIHIDPNDQDHVYVTLGGYAPNNVWESTNGGQTWTVLQGLPTAPVRDIKLHPTNPNILFLATEVGLLVSDDGGSTWNSSATPAYVSIDELFWSGGDLYLATHGLGMFRQTPAAAAASVSQGTGCTLGGPATGPQLSATPPQLGGLSILTATGATPGGVAALFGSPAPAGPTPITATCFAQVDPVTMAPLGTQFVSSFGAASWFLLIPNIPALSGQQWMVQAAVISGPTVSVSNGQLLTTGT